MPLADVLFISRWINPPVQAMGRPLSAAFVKLSFFPLSDTGITHKPEINLLDLLIPAQMIAFWQANRITEPGDIN
jgi:hypothetical protein